MSRVTAVPAFFLFVVMCASASLQAQPTLTSLSFGQTSLVGSSTDSITGTVNIHRDVNDTQPVYISFNEDIGGIVQFSTSLVIQSPNTSIDFSLIGNLVATDTPVAITAFCDNGSCTGSTTVTVTVKPFSLALSASSEIAQGQQGSGQVTLTPPTRANTGVFLTENVLGLSFPDFVIVPAGQSSQGFGIGIANAVSQPTTITLTGSVGGGPPATAQVTIGPPSFDIQADLGFCLNCFLNQLLNAIGSPINVANGNTYVQKTDFSVPTHAGKPLEITRTWNGLWLSSNPFTTGGLFGNGWMSNYDQRLQLVSSTSLKYWGADGKAWSFTRNTITQPWVLVNPADAHAVLTFDTDAQRYILLFKDGSQSQFNTDGLLVDVADVLQYFEELSYDPNDTTKLVTLSGLLNFSYEDPNNPHHVTTVTDANNGLAYHYSYDAGGRLLQVTYPDGTHNSYQYDSNSLLLSVTDNEGKILEAHTYDAQRRGLTSVRAGGVDQVAVTYPQFGAAQITNSAGTSTSFGYTFAGGHRLITSISGTGCSTCGGQGNKTFTYDPSGNMSTSTNDLGLTTSYLYDANGNVIQKSTPLPGGGTQTYSYTYNNFGEVLTATDPLGTTTTNTYDIFANLLSSTVSGAGQTPLTTTFTVDPDTALTTAVTDPLGHTTQFHYIVTVDSQGFIFSDGLVDAVTDAQGNVTHFEYSTSNNRTAVVDALGNRTTYAYDNMFRLTGVTNPDSSATNFAYDSRGRRTSVTDANAKVTTYSYDDADRLTTVTDAATHATGYAYDTESNLLSITDALGRATSYTYDDQRRVTRTTFPSGHSESYGYDGVGNLLFKTDRNMNTTSFIYDGLNRLAQKHYPDATTVNYTYDVANRLTQVTDATGTYGFTYDSLNRLTYSSTAYSFLPGSNFNVGYGYDAASNRTSLAYPGSGGSLNYGYDSLNRLTSLADSVTGSFSFAYDALGRRTSLTRPNGVSTAYNFDSVSNLLSIAHSKSGATVDGATYDYDPVGNRNTRADLRIPDTSTFAYDATYQLAQAVRAKGPIAVDDPPVPVITETDYTYDAVGNRLSDTTPDNGANLYQYNNSNQLLSAHSTWDPHPFFTQTYDANGNTLNHAAADQTTTYTWDFENRLTHIANGSATGSYKYDPFGRRIQAVSSVQGTTNYVYDGASIIAEVNSSGAVTKRYVQGAGIDEPLALQQGATTSYYQADGLGSITSLTDASGSIAGFTSYSSPWGDADASGFAFTGRELDSDFGLYYYRARYYDPKMGRFLSEDPIGFAGDINFYRYALNSPMNLIDPSGEQVGTVALGAGGVATAVGAAATTGAGSAVVAGLATGGAVVAAGTAGWGIGRGIGHIPIGNGRTIDDLVADTFTDTILLFRPNPKAPDKCKRGRKECDLLYAEDTAFCNSLASENRACHAQALERYAACLAGKQIPPLPWRKPN